MNAIVSQIWNNSQYKNVLNKNLNYNCNWKLTAVSCK